MKNIKIQVHAIATEPNLVTEAQVKDMLAATSWFYLTIGIAFKLASFEEVFNERLEKDGITGPPPSETELIRAAWAVRYPGRLVIFFRAGGGGYSSAGGEYVVMYGADAKSFAHEAGHYLHLGHTHNDDATGKLDEANSKKGNAEARNVAIGLIRENRGLGVFDGDFPGVKDTPPDPGPPLFQVSPFNEDGNSTGGEEYCGATTTLVVDGVSHTLKSSTNIMSYFFACPGNLTISPDQQKIILDALTIGNRRHLLEGATAEGPAAIVTNDGAIHVFGRGDDLNIWHGFLAAEVWSGWSPDMGAGTLTSGPAAAVSLDGAIHVFAVGTDRNIWHTFRNGSVWSGWHDDAGHGSFTSAPTAVVSADGAIHLFARGDDGNIWHNFWKGNAWNGWRNYLGDGTFTSGPAAVISQDGAIHVFATGDDRNIWHTYWDGNAWSGWHDNADHGTFTSRPAAVVSPDGSIHLVARGDDRKLWHNFWKGNGWHGWHANLSNQTFLSGATAVVTADQAIHLFAQDDDRRLWHSFTTHRKWSTWGDGGSNLWLNPWTMWEPDPSGGTFQP